MDTSDPVVQNVDPLLGPSVNQDIAAVEIKLHIRAFELIDVIARLDRTQQKIIPHVFDADFDPQLFGGRDQLFNTFGRTVPAIVIANLLVDDTRHQQHGVGTVRLRVFHRDDHRVDPLLPHGGIRMRERFRPMVDVADARRHETGLPHGGQHFIAIHVAIGLDSVVTRDFDRLALVQHGTLHAHRSPHDRLTEIAGNRLLVIGRNRHGIG